MKKFTLFLFALLMISFSVLAQIKLVVCQEGGIRSEFIASNVDSIIFVGLEDTPDVPVKPDDGDDDIDIPEVELPGEGKIRFLIDATAVDACYGIGIEGGFNGWNAFEPLQGTEFAENMFYIDMPSMTAVEFGNAKILLLNEDGSSDWGYLVSSNGYDITGSEDYITLVDDYGTQNAINLVADNIDNVVIKIAILEVESNPCKPVLAGYAKFVLTVKGDIPEGKKVIFTGNFGAGNDEWGASTREMTKQADGTYVWEGAYPENFQFKAFIADCEDLGFGEDDYGYIYSELWLEGANRLVELGSGSVIEFEGCFEFLCPEDGDIIDPDKPINPDDDEIINPEVELPGEGKIRFLIDATAVGACYGLGIEGNFCGYNPDAAFKGTEFADNMFNIDLPAMTAEEFGNAKILLLAEDGTSSWDYQVSSSGYDITGSEEYITLIDDYDSSGDIGTQNSINLISDNIDNVVIKVAILAVNYTPCKTIVPGTNNHEYVDLGLPSGTLWATCNVGATSPEDYGDYFAWGEISPKYSYTSTNYTYMDSPDSLPLSADAASVNWGGDWHMPTIEQINELLDSSNCDWIFTTMNGVEGQMVTSKYNGNSIFLPAAGNIEDDVYWWQGRCACYWSSDKSDIYSGRSYIMNFCESSIGSYDDGLRSNAFSVRPVLGYKKNESVTPEEEDVFYEEIITGYENGYGYVDLGLPSGILWATCNVGADSPEGYGNFYAWGETQPKSDYTTANYKWCSGDLSSLTKYCTDSYYGIVDNKTILDKEDDAAHVNLGGNWRMPTREERDELYKNCTWKKTKYKGINGYVVISKINGNMLFIPASGCFGNSIYFNEGEYANYWTSSVNLSIPNEAYDMSYDEWDEGSREFGQNVRGVLSPSTSNPIIPEGSNFVAQPFSVSATKTVTFSPGNLQYHAANNEWRFAPNQTDYIGEDNANISSTYNGWIDLFGWGTGNNPTNTSKYNGDYQTFVDWGVNKIGNYAPNTWRTLTYGEWEYLIEERPNYDKLIGAAQVNGVNGLILLPDNWTCPSGVTFKSGFHDYYGTDYYAEYQTFSSSEWSKLEASGAVFFPAAGSRYGSLLVDSVQNFGFYWSATEGDYYTAYYLSFNSDEAYMYNYNRYYGQSVRLVQD